MDPKMIFAAIDERKDELFDLLCRLVRINSENFGYKGNEKEIRENDPLTLSLSLTKDDFTFAVTSSDGAKRFVAGGSLREEV